MLLSLGIVTGIVAQALFNISVVLSLVPTKGIPLPFISYGGSSLVPTLAAVGILLNVSQHASGVDRQFRNCRLPTISKSAMNERSGVAIGESRNRAIGNAMRVLIAAGGTGGHIYPGIAVAKEIMRRDPNSKVQICRHGARIGNTIGAASGF